MKKIIYSLLITTVINLFGAQNTNPCCQELSQRIIALQEDFAQREFVLTNEKEEHTQTRKELSQIKNQFHDLENNFSKMNKDLAETMTKLTNLGLENSEAQRRISFQTKARDILNEEHRKTLAEKDTLIKNLNSQTAELSKEKNILNEKLKMLQDQYNTTISQNKTEQTKLNEEIEAHLKNIGTLKQTISRQEATIIELGESLRSNANMSSTGDATRLTLLNKQISQYQTKVTQLETGISNLSNEKTRLEDANKKLKTQIEQLTEENKKNLLNLAQLRNQKQQDPSEKIETHKKTFEPTNNDKHAKEIKTRNYLLGGAGFIIAGLLAYIYKFNSSIAA